MATLAHPTPAMPHHAQLQLRLHQTNTIYSRSSFQLEISSAFSFYARELNLVSKSRHMNKLYCEIIKTRGKYWKKRKLFGGKITDTMKRFRRKKFLFSNL